MTEPTPEPRVYTRAELRDHAFYVANQADILAASREGRIVNDTNDQEQ